MRILIENSGYALSNLGDVAMLKAALARFQVCFENPELHVVTAHPTRLESLCPDAVAVDSSGGFAWRLQSLFPGLILPALRPVEDSAKSRFPRFYLAVAERIGRRRDALAGMARYLEAIQGADAVFVTGGGFFSDPFREHARGILNTLEIATSLGKPIAFFGQGLGPLTSPGLRKALRGQLRRAVACGLREGVGCRDLVAGLETRMTVTGDDALSLLSPFEAPPLPDQVTIGLTVRETDYSGVHSSAEAGFREAFDEIDTRFQPQWCPLPVETLERDADGPAISRLLRGRTVPDWAEWDGNPELAGFFQRLRRCSLVVTGSYHTAVFALGSGIPAVGLIGSEYYARKFAGLHSFFPGQMTTVDVSGEGWPASLVEAIATAMDRGNCRECRSVARDLASRGDSLAAYVAHVVSGREVEGKI